MTLMELVFVVLQAVFLLLLAPFALALLKLIWQFNTIILVVILILVAIDIATHGTVEQMSQSGQTLAFVACLLLGGKMLNFIRKL